MFSQACSRGNLARQNFQVMLEEWKQKKHRGETKRLKEEESSDLRGKENSGYKDVSSVTSIITKDSSTTGASEIPKPSEPAQPPPRRKSNLQVQLQ